MICIPERYSYIEAYLTLRCNMSCSYCINAHGGLARLRKELTAHEWIAGLNNIDTKGKPLTIGGGEPTIHPGFYEIIQGLKPDTKIDLLTNGKFNIEEFAANIEPSRFYKAKDSYYKSIRISYHAESMDKDSLVNKAAWLQARGYNVGVFGLNYPTNLLHNVEMTQKCANAGIYFFVRDFLGFYKDRLYGYYKYPEALNGNRKRCLCRAEDFLIGTDGSVFKCHRDLYAEAEPVGNILNIAYSIKDEFFQCDNYGLCSPCDVKIKGKPSLSEFKCSVEIKP